MAYRDEARRALESQRARTQQNTSFGSMKPARSALDPFDTVDELLAFLRDPSEDRDRKDRVLLELIAEQQTAPRSGAFAILSAAMFPMLDRLYRSRVRYVRPSERDELWSRVFSAFAEAVTRYPIASRPRRVAANLRGETLASLRRGTVADIALQKTRTTLATEVVPHLASDADGVVGVFDLVPSSDVTPTDPERDMEEASHALDGYMIAGLISESDRALILGVYVGGRSIASIAKELGISREAAKKRLQRAVGRIRIGRPMRNGREMKGMETMLRYDSTRADVDVDALIMDPNREGIAIVAYGSPIPRAGEEIEYEEDGTRYVLRVVRFHPRAPTPRMRRFHARPDYWLTVRLQRISDFDVVEDPR